MQRATWWALLAAIGLMGLMTVLQTAPFPLPWIAPAMTMFLPPLCIFPALRCAALRKRALQQLSREQQTEQQRLLLACQLLHSRADALTAERRQLLGQIEALRRAQISQNV